MATLATYASTFTFGWVYDDPPQIPQNQNLEFSRLGFLFTHQLWASMAGTDARFYRPLLTVWFLINKTLFGLNPHWFHVTTVLAHLAASAFAFFVARALLEDAGSALFASAIFALHPLQVESASWISSVNDSLAATLCFATFLTYRRARTTQQNSAAWWILSGVLFLLALFTKEVSVVLPGIILVDLWLNRTADNRSASAGRSVLAAISPYAVILLLWLALRSWALGATAGTSSATSWSSCLLTAPKIVLFDLYRVFVPVGLSPQYDFRAVESPASGQFLLVMIAVIALAALAVRVARRDPRLWVAFAWLIFPMLPAFNLRWMNQDDFVHDRYMYMSMLGVALLAGSAYGWIRKKWPNAQFVRPLAACIAVVLAFASAIQSQYWANDVILFSRAVSRAPDNEWAQLNYGSALSARDKFADAAPHFVRSYELKPGWRAADFAGFAYQHTGDLPEAERWFQLALQQDPRVAPPWFGLGQIRLSQHRPEEAIQFFQQALSIDGTAEGFHYEMGQALEQDSQPLLALGEYREELRLHPEGSAARRAIDRLQAAAQSAK